MDTSSQFSKIKVSEYDFSQCVAHQYEDNGFQPTYLVSFWEQKVDLTDGEDDDGGELYWHETGYILTGASSVTEAIKWQIDNAKERPAATFLLIRYDSPAAIGDVSNERSEKPAQRHQALLLHGKVPSGKIRDDSNFFEFTMMSPEE